jgi:flagellin
VGIRINQNIMAMNSYRNLTTSESQLSKSLEKLSSGFRINKAADDASGLVISEGLRSQVRGLKMAIKNTQDGVSVVQTAEGALTEVHSLLQRIRELAVQASSTGSSDPAARDAAQAEVVQLVSEVDRIAQTTRFGGQKLLDGTYGQTAITGVAVDNGTAATLQAAKTVGDPAVFAAALDLDFGAAPTALTVSLDGAPSVQLALIGNITAATNTADIAPLLQTALNNSIAANATLAGNLTAVVTLNAGATAFTVTFERAGNLAQGEAVSVTAGTTNVNDGTFFTALMGTPADVATAVIANGTAGSFSTDASTLGATAAKVAGSLVNPLNTNYTTVNQSFEVSLDGGTTWNRVELNTDLSNPADARSALSTALNTALDTAITGDLVDAEVIWGDDEAHLQVQLRTNALGSDQQIMTRAADTSVADGGDADAIVDDLHADLFGSANGLSGSGTSAGGVFQVGADALETIQVNIQDIQTDNLGVFTNGVIATGDSIRELDIATDASGALSIIDAAITQVSVQRGNLGAIQNRFEHTIANLSVTVENLSASESRIRDTDMAEEMMSFTRAQILQQAGTAMLAQANAVPQSVLQLLQ